MCGDQMWILGLRGRSLSVSMMYILHTAIRTFPKVVMRICSTIEVFSLLYDFFFSVIGFKM